MADAIEMVFDGSAVTKWLKGMQDRLKKIEAQERAFVNSIGIFVFQDVMDHFKKQAGPDKPWEKWSTTYTNHMKKIGKSGNKILQDSGTLRQSFKAGQWRKSSGGVEWYNNAHTKGGFPYAYAHNEGGSQLPKREFMWLSEGALEKISEATVAFLAGD